MDTNTVPMRQLLALSAPSFVLTLIMGPLTGILPTIYAKNFGLDLAAIGTVLMATNLIDAVTDPMMGYVSDNTKTRFGRRRPWVLLGYMLTLIAIYNLFLPPETVSIAYFATGYILFHVFQTIGTIPLTAWQVELSSDYKQRTRVITFGNMSSVLGGLMFTAIPFLPIFPKSEFSLEVLRVMGWCCLFLLPPATLLAVFIVPEGNLIPAQKPNSALNDFWTLITNKPFLYTLTLGSLYGIGNGISVGGGYMYIDTYLLLGDKYPIVMFLGMITGFAMMPVGMKIMNRFGKHRTFSVTLALNGLLLPLFLLFEPETEAFMFLIIFMVINMAISAVSILPPMSMIGDVVDYDTLKTGASRTGQFNSILGLTLKGTMAFGTGIGFFLLKIFNYDATVTVHDPESIFGIQMTIVWLPALFFLLTALAAWYFPIDERQQRIIERRIKSLAARSKRDGQLGTKTPEPCNSPASC